MTSFAITVCSEVLEQSNATEYKWLQNNWNYFLSYYDYTLLLIFPRVFILLPHLIPKPQVFLVLLVWFGWKRLGTRGWSCGGLKELSIIALFSTIPFRPDTTGLYMKMTGGMPALVSTARCQQGANSRHRYDKLKHPWLFLGSETNEYDLWFLWM